MRFAGLDVHKREVEACILDERGRVLLRKRFPCTREQLRAFARVHLGKSCRVALEATTNTWGVAAVLAPLVSDLVVSNPLRTRAIAEAKVKTDKVDALVLAQLLRTDFLPKVWTPDEHTQSLRRLCTHRACLVADRTRVKNRIHALLHQRLIDVPFDDLFSKAGRAWLGALKLEDDARSFLEAQLKLLALVEAEIETANEALAIGADADPRAKLLLTLPGVDVTVAQSLLAALGDLSRFKDADHAAAYLGLVPSTKQSGDNCYHGPITKQGRGHARWMLVQAAQHVARHPGPLGVFFRRLAQKKNRNVAVVATARKLVTIAWHMLKNNEPYRYAQPRPTEAKLSRVRVAAGKRRTSGPQKRTQRKKTTQPKQPMRVIPSLPDLYKSEGLPPTNPPPGEQKMLEGVHLVRYARSLEKTHRVPRRRKEPKS
jgi:transposase